LDIIVLGVNLIMLVLDKMLTWLPSKMDIVGVLDAANSSPKRLTITRLDVHGGHAGMSPVQMVPHLQVADGGPPPPPPPPPPAPEEAMTWKKRGSGT